MARQKEIISRDRINQMESRNKLIWLLMIIGSAVGGFIPSLWGSDMFSISSVIFTAIGGFVGIWLGFKLGS